MKIAPSPSQLLTVIPKPRAAVARQVIVQTDSSQRQVLRAPVANPSSHPGVQQYQQNASLDAELGKTIALLGVDTYV